MTRALPILFTLLAAFTVPLCGVMAAEDVTIFRVDQPEATNVDFGFSIEGISAVNMNKEGVTKYVVSEVQSRYVLKASFTTTTLFTTPTTVTYTIEQGASMYNGEVDNNNAVPGKNAVAVNTIACKGDPNGVDAACTDILRVTGKDVIATATTSTYKGRLVPIYTITGGATALPTTSGARHGYSVPLYPGALVVMILGAGLWAL